MKKGQMELFDNAMDVHPDRSGLPKHFDALVDALGGVAKLRGMILELAIRGRLVPQDPHVEPAIAFLKRIAAERKNFSGAGRGRAPKLPEEELTCEPSFDPPPGWTWVRIGEIFDVVGGLQKTPKRAPVDNHYPYLRVENVQRGRLDLSRIERFELLQGELDRLRLMVGDLLVVEGNGSETEIGRCARWEGAIEDCVHQNHLIRCRPIAPLKSDFALLFLNSPSGIAQMKKLAITTSGLFSLSVGKIRGIATPMPPLAEQERIVAKVDQLMALCDELEARQTRKRDTGDRLTKAALGALTSADGPDELQVAWREFAGNFGELIERPERVSHLRQSILDLIISDKLLLSAQATAPVASTADLSKALIQPRAAAKGASADQSLSPMASLKDVLAIPLANGRSVPDDPNGFPVLRLSALRGQHVDFAEHKLGSWTADQAAPHVVEEGDVLFVRGNGAKRLVGRACIVPKPTMRVAYPDTAIRARLNCEVIEPLWLWYVWESGFVRRQIEVAARTTAGIFKVSQDDLYAVRFPLPAIAEQRRRLAVLERVMKLCDDLEAKLRARDEKSTRLAAALVAEAIA